MRERETYEEIMAKKTPEERKQTEDLFLVLKIMPVIFIIGIIAMAAVSSNRSSSSDESSKAWNDLMYERQQHDKRMGEMNPHEKQFLLEKRLGR